MPRKLTIDGLKADLSSIKELLRSAQEMDDPIGEYQLALRKESIEQELQRLGATVQTAASVALFFGGNPVMGSRGISADFAGNMLEHFQNLVTRTFAAAEIGALGERGPVPMRKISNLMVTNVTRGSFGFVLNELSDQNEMQDTALKTVVSEAVSILEKISSSNEADFEEVTERIDGRMLTPLKDFFKTLDTSDATIRLVDDVTEIALDANAIHRGRVRTEDISIEETDIATEGFLAGFLPEHRKFELRVNHGETIYGSVSKEASEQYALLVQQGDSPMHQTWRVRLRQRTVKPLNKPPREVFRLLEFLSKVESEPQGAGNS